MINLKENPTLVEKLKKYGLIPSDTEKLAPEELEALIEGVQSKIESEKKARLDIPNRGNGEMFRNLIQVTCLGLATVSTHLVNNGLRFFPGKEEKEIQQAHLFTFEVMLHLVIGSELLKTVFKEIAATIDTTIENQNLITEILTLSAILLTILSASKGNRATMETLTLNAAPELIKGLDKVEKYVNDRSIDSAFGSDTAKKVALNLNRVRLALKKEDFNAFFAAYEATLKLIGLDHEKIIKDLKQFEITASKLAENLTTSQVDETLTTMSQAM